MAINQYNPNIPQPTDLLSNSQPQLLLNFQSLQAWIDVNHVDYNDNLGNAGKHLYVVCPNTANYPNSPWPNGTFNGTDTGFYNFTSISNAATASLWLHPSRSTTTVNDFNVGGGIFGPDGWGYLTSGLLVQWGMSSLAATTTSTLITFPTVNTPSYNHGVFVVLAQIQRATMIQGGAYDIGVSNFTTTGFKAITNVDPAVSGNLPVNFFWVALGY